jgi:hypothetical protein
MSLASTIIMNAMPCFFIAFKFGLAGAPVLPIQDIWADICKKYYA